MSERGDKPSHEAQRRAGEMELARLRAALALREQALEYCLEGITIADCSQPDLPLIYVNRGFERLTGYSREEVLGRNCRFLQGPATAPGALGTIREAIQRGRACTVELLNHRKDGTTFWNRLALTPLHDDNGILTHYVGIQSDVSERVRAQEELRAAYAEMARSLNAAAKVQQALLPASSPVIDPLRVAWRFRPCEALAGDILNVFPLDDTHVGVYLLDVTGHGAPAALLAVSVSQLLAPEARTSSLVRELTTAAGDRIVPPAEVAGRLNTRFTWDTSRGQFFTLIYGILDTRSLSFEYVCAGHPPPELKNADGVCPLPGGEGLPIGVGNAPYVAQTVQLHPGDRVLLYSDGVCDVRNTQGMLLGRERLREIWAAGADMPIEQALDGVLEQTDAWAGERAIEDDLSLLALEIASQGAASRRSG